MRVSIPVLLGYTLLYLVPDLLVFAFVDGVAPQKDLRSIAYVLATALCVAMVQNGRIRLALATVVWALQAGWLLSFVYFKDPVRPEQLLVAVADFGDLASSFLGEFSILLLPSAALVAQFALLVAYDRWLVAPFGPKLRYLPLLPVLLIVGVAVRPMLMSNAFAAAATRSTASPVAMLSTFGIFARMALSQPVVAPGNMVGLLSARPVPLPDRVGDEPVTVAVVMGESITPLRMGLYGGQTGPASPIVGRAADTGGAFRLFTKLGFSAGVGTLASVPAFMRVSYFPSNVEMPSFDLFDLAQRSGFRTYYLSVQKVGLLQVAGAMAHVDEFHDYWRWPARVDAVRDAILLEHLQRADADAAPLRLIFLNQRVNHVPYLQNCPQTPNDPAMIEASGEARRDHYDVGMKCYEANLDAILTHLGAQKGAVYVFVTADHSELTGEYGLWGHLVNNVYNALVPMMLYTNRPDSTIAREFQALRLPTAFEMSRLVAAAVGWRVDAAGYDPDVFYVNYTMPFGLAGYFQARKTDGPRMPFKQFRRDGQVSRDELFELPPAAFLHAR